MKFHIGINVAEIFSAQITMRMSRLESYWKFGTFET